MVQPKDVILFNKILEFAQTVLSEDQENEVYKQTASVLLTLGSHVLMGGKYLERLALEVVTIGAVDLEHYKQEIARQASNN